MDYPGTPRGCFWCGSSLVQQKACSLFGAISLPETVFTHCQLLRNILLRKDVSLLTVVSWYYMGRHKLTASGGIFQPSCVCMIASVYGISGVCLCYKCIISLFVDWCIQHTLAIIKLKRFNIACGNGLSPTRYQAIVAIKCSIANKGTTKLPLPWASGHPVAIQCTWHLGPSVHWNATGERILVASVLPVVFQWLFSGLPVCSNYAN